MDKKHKTWSNYRWWIMVVLFSPLFLGMSLIWLLGGIFEITGSFLNSIVHSNTPKWMVKVFDWVKKG